MKLEIFLTLFLTVVVLSLPQPEDQQPAVHVDDHEHSGSHDGEPMDQESGDDYAQEKDQEKEGVEVTHAPGDTVVCQQEPCEKKEAQHDLEEVHLEEEKSQTTSTRK